MKKMAPWLITILLSITLIVLAAFLVLKMDKGTTPTQAVKEVQVERKSADEIAESTSVLSDIRTNLSDPSYVVVLDFAFQLNDAKAKEDFDKISAYKVNPIIIKTLADTKPEELNGAKGKDQLCAKLLSLINKVLPEGNLIQIDITKFIMQPIG